MSRILIDGRFVGIGESMTRYCLEALSGILKLDDKNDYTLLIRPIGKKELKWYPEIEKAPNLKIEIKDIKHYSFGEQTQLLKYLNREKFDLVHFIQFNHPVRYRGKFIVTIHDLTLINHSGSNPIKRLAFLKVMRSAAKNSQKVISISKATENDIIYTLRIPKNKIRTIYHGVDTERFNIRAKGETEILNKFRQKNKIENDYLLYVGAWKKHKNLSTLLLAYEKYLKEDKKFVHLVLVGKIDEKEKEVLDQIGRINKTFAPDSKLPTPIILAGPIDVRSEELPVIYAGALAYIIPSFAEGFGWPPLEAMASGTPVISSDISSMPEILGEGAYYFNPKNADDLTKAIDRVISDRSLRENLIKKGLLQVQKYDWSKTAKETLAVYREVLNQN